MHDELDLLVLGREVDEGLFLEFAGSAREVGADNLGGESSSIDIILGNIGRVTFDLLSLSLGGGSGSLDRRFDNGLGDNLLLLTGTLRLRLLSNWGAGTLANGSFGFAIE